MPYHDVDGDRGPAPMMPDGWEDQFEVRTFHKDNPPEQAEGLSSIYRDLNEQVQVMINCDLMTTYHSTAIEDVPIEVRARVEELFREGEDHESCQ